MSERRLRQRRITLCADDYGISRSVDQAIRDLLARRRINATSVMVLAPAFDAAEARALQALRDNGDAAVGLHVTLTAPFAPMSPGFRPLRDGAFPRLQTLLGLATARRLDPPSLSHEIAAQLQAFADAFGTPPDFVDGHQHVQLFPQIRDAFLDAVARHAPQAWVRQCGRPAQQAGRWRDRKGLLLDILSVGFRRRAAQRGLRSNAAFAGTYDFRDDADVAALFPRFFDGLPDGGLVMCHPGLVDAELRRLDPLTTLREREYAYFGGEPFARLLQDQGIVLHA
ncbi:MAG TPA: ChbG/HpnK family deacetylase [Pseudolabrys sp.]|nr:ChbG/HpnK family deacetylase [Pseudolabrys sp.]